MIDLHSHILPGFDDGATDLDASLAIARAAVADGTTTIVATPHVSLTYDARPEAVTDGAERLRGALSEEEIDLTLATGAEVAVPRLGALDDEALRSLCLGDGGYLLVESPYSAAPFLEEQLFSVRTRGFHPLLAHPERCQLFQRDRGRLERIVAQGTVCSVTAGSLAGRFGSQVRRFAFDLLRAGLVHDVSSDAHDTVRRPPGLSVGIESLLSAMPELASQVDWLARDAPDAILRGEPVPRRPQAHARSASRRWRRWRR